MGMLAIHHDFRRLNGDESSSLSETVSLLPLMMANTIGGGIYERANASSEMDPRLFWD